MADPQLIHIRLPRDLHDAVTEAAADQGVSMNTYIVTLLAGATGWQPTPEGGKTR